MIALLILAIICAALAVFVYQRFADRPGDDFGVAMIFVILAVLAVIFFAAYSVLAIWRHSFL